MTKTSISSNKNVPLPRTKMAKKNKNMKKGKAHHWSVPDDQKVAKVVYVPTGKPRGRPKGYKNVGGTPKAKVASGKPKGRPAKE